MRQLAWVAFVLAACATPELPATYAGSRPARFGPGDETQVRVTLQTGSDARVQAAFIAAERRFYGEGTWRREGDRIVIDLREPPQRLVFGVSSDQLIAREWDRPTWGEAGPGVLYRVFRPTLTE